MQQWDEALINSVAENFGVGAVRTLVYKVQGDTGGMAISQDGTGFACVDLVANNQDGGERLLQGILSLQFSPKSSRFTKVAWNTVASQIPTFFGQSLANSTATSPSAESLGSQVVSPSVVSLDHDKSNDSHGINI